MSQWWMVARTVRAPRQQLARCEQCDVSVLRARRIGFPERENDHPSGCHSAGLTLQRQADTKTVCNDKSPGDGSPGLPSDRMTPIACASSKLPPWLPRCESSPVTTDPPSGPL